MPCPSCTAQTPSGARFCPDCGVALEHRCPSCAEVHEPGQRFCASCGTPLGAEVASSAAAPEHVARSTPETVAAPELRHVTVLFCDLVGYTELSDGRDADDVRAVLSGYFDLARDIVGRYGGVVEKFIGDAVMAVWGAASSHEDDAERATRAALDLVAAVARYGEEAGTPELAARVGVATGQAATVEARHEGIVVGDRVNIASRVQSEAEPGTVLVDAATREQCTASFVWTDTGEHVLKGKDEPLRLWRAVRTYSHGDSDSDGLEAAFTGRDRELDLVKDRFHRTVESRTAERVSVTGHAGLGKSRLYREFRSYVVGLASTNYVHVGRCLSYGDGITYWALAEMVRQRFGVAEADPESRILELVGQKTPELVPEPFARPVVERAVRALLGVGKETLSRDELFAGWRLLFEQLARTYPVILVLEDVQWADTDLLDFIEQVTEWSSESPIFVLTLSRPELLERRPSWNAARRNVTPLILDRLPDAAMSRILDDLVELPAEVRDRIVARADGTPLYAVEMVRVLLDRGIVQLGEDGRRRLVGTVDELDVPASLTALASARIDALAADERILVRDLAVFGGGFPRDAVTGMTSLPADRAEAAVAGLLRKGVLSLRTDPLSPERGQLSFDQVILRTTALETLPRRERVAQHLRAARHLRSSFPDDGEEVTELIARHYRDAHDLSGDDVSLDAAEALDEAGRMFRRAGERARSLGASEAALRCYLNARECTADVHERSSLTADACEVAFLCGEYERALELADEVEPQLRSDGWTHEANQVVLIRARARANAGDLAGGIDDIRAALDLTDDDDAGRAELLASMSTKLMVLGREDEAIAAAEEAMATAEALDLTGVVADAAMAKAAILSSIGRNREALAISEMAVEILEAQGPTSKLAVAQLNRGEFLIHDDRPGGRAHEDEVILLARRAGDRPLERMAVGNRGLLDVLLGRWDDVVTACSEGPSTDPGTALDYAMIPLVMVAALRGRADEAAQHAEKLKPVEGNDDPQSEEAYAMAQGYVALSRGDRAAALAHLRSGTSLEPGAAAGLLRSDGPRYAWPRAVELAFELGREDDLRSALAVVADRPPGHVPPYLRAVVGFTTGRIAARAGRHDEAEERMRAALSAFDEMGYRYWHARSRVPYADWLVGRGRPTDAAAELREAESVLTPIGATLDLARVAEVRQRLSSGVGTAAV